MSHPIHARGGPYPSKSAGLGGLPTITTDIPICAVFISIYLCFAATNSTIFRRNRRKHHKFILSILLTGFSMARVATLVLRIAWATRQHNTRLAIAAQIFVNVGILIVYIINLILAQRVLRAKQPHIGWNPVVRLSYKILYFSIPVALVMVICSVVISVYTLNTHTRSICRDIQLAALTYLLCFTCLPLIQVVVAISLPKSKDEESFGEGSMLSKLIILPASSSLCMLIAGFKAGATWSPPRPATNPPWYDSKACFYIFNFTLEIIILSILTFSRFDTRFHVPDGCKQAGDYTRFGQERTLEGENGSLELEEGKKRSGEL